MRPTGRQERVIRIWLHRQPGARQLWQRPSAVQGVAESSRSALAGAAVFRARRTAASSVGAPVPGAVDVYQLTGGGDGVGTHQIAVGQQPLPVQLGPLLRRGGQVPVDDGVVPGVDCGGKAALPDGLAAAPGHRAAGGQQRQRPLHHLGGGGHPYGVKAPAPEGVHSGKGQLFPLAGNGCILHRTYPLSRRRTACFSPL